MTSESNRGATEEELRKGLKGAREPRVEFSGVKREGSCKGIGREIPRGFCDWRLEVEGSIDSQTEPSRGGQEPARM